MQTERYFPVILLVLGYLAIVEGYMHMKIQTNLQEQLNFNSGSYINVSLLRNNEFICNHWHNEAEIILPLEGSVRINLNMNPYFLNQHDILFSYPGELHTLEKSSNNLVMVLQFPFSLINNLDDMRPSVPILRSVKLITKDKDPDIHKYILACLQDIRDKHVNEEDFASSAMYANLIRIFVLIAKKYTKFSRLFPKTTVDKGREYIVKFTNVLDYINENFADDISLESIADSAGYSKFHFSRLFKQFTNMSFNDYVNSVRISKAENMLISGSLSITQVASMSGFNSLSSFNRNFKLVKKCTPSEFMSMYDQF